MKTLLITIVICLMTSAVTAQFPPFPEGDRIPIPEGTTITGEISADNPVAIYEFIAPREGWMVIYHGTDFEALRQEHSITGPSRSAGRGNSVFDNRVEVSLHHVDEMDIFRVAFSSLNGEYGRYTLHYEYVDPETAPALEYGEIVEGQFDEQQLFQVYTFSAGLGDAVEFEYADTLGMLFTNIGEDRLYSQHSYPAYFHHELWESGKPQVFLTREGMYAVVVWTELMAAQEPYTLEIVHHEATLAEIPQFVRLTPDSPEQTLTFTPPQNGAYSVRVRFQLPQTAATMSFRQHGVSFLELSGAVGTSGLMDVAGYFARSSTDSIEVVFTGTQFASWLGEEPVIDLVVSLTYCGDTLCLP